MPSRKPTKLELVNASSVRDILNRKVSTQPSQLVPIEKIRVPAKQPRRFFNEGKLTQLIESVKEFGILEPLLVRPVKGNEYELVAGERRLRAAHELGLSEVPIAVHVLNDQQALQVALMENLQREDLNPVEETEAILELLAITLAISREEVTSILYQSYNAKQRGQELNQNVLIQLEQIESLLTEIGRFNARTFRSSRLPLLNLPEDVLSALRKGEIEYTKAQIIARVKNKPQRVELLKQAIAKKLSLSEIKAKIQALKPESAAPSDEKVAAQRLSEIGKRLQRSQIWSDPRKRTRITKLLDELDRLTHLED